MFYGFSTVVIQRIGFHQGPPRTIWQGPRRPLHKWLLLKSALPVYRGSQERIAKWWLDSWTRAQRELPAGVWLLIFDLIRHRLNCAARNISDIPDCRMSLKLASTEYRLWAAMVNVNGKHCGFRHSTALHDNSTLLLRRCWFVMFC